MIGAPFTGPYRNASVVHDYYCEARTRRAKDVHRMFYWAMRTSGVGDRRAWLMYQAVDKFGPRWTDPGIPRECQIITENYDFSKCARNSTVPPKTVPTPTNAEIKEFLKSVQPRADTRDIDKLLSKL